MSELEPKPLSPSGIPEYSRADANQYILDNEAENISPHEPEQVAISSQDQLALEIIAQRVGGDFGMTVRMGQPGAGSFFDPKEVSITLDPVQIKENPSMAKFVAGHEGAHRAITPGPYKLGQTDEQVKTAYSQIGFGYTQNVIEDAAVNTWMSQRFPGMQEYIGEVYDKQFASEDAVLSTPEVQQVAAQLGYWPRFARYGSEILRDWHQQRFSSTTDEKVGRALERTIDDSRRAWHRLPDAQRLDQREIVATGRDRFQITNDFVWPEVKKLVEMDLHTEEFRQMVSDMMSIEETLDRLRQEQQSAQQSGDPERAKQLNQEIAQQEAKKELFDKLAESARLELEEAIAQVMEELAKQKQNQTEDTMQETQQAQRGLQSGQPEVPFPEDQLSQQTKQELEKVARSLPPSLRQTYREKAQSTLETFEDQLNKTLQGKLEEGIPPSHQEQHTQEQARANARASEARRQAETTKAQEKLQQIRQETMSPYEQARAEVVGLIDDLYFRLRRILKPEDYGGEDMGYPSGQRLDINRAMQADYDPEQAHRLFIRETAPKKRDYRFWHLIDLSGSMKGRKIEETLKGFIVAGEAIDRTEALNSEAITIHQGITGYHNRVFPFKALKERFTAEVEQTLSQIPDRTQDRDAMTDTYAGTLVALRELGQDLGVTGNFLLTFTDGQPDFDVRQQLSHLLKGTREERVKQKIKVGVVWLGESGDEAQLTELIEEYGYDFGLVMPAIRDSSSPESKNFAQALGDLLEDIVEQPDKY